ncbi:MAG: S-layer homology domain-containing protein, partial [Clostridia bacterium]|nr:S-layer homology domain-containing protein [Clostridia bacterium]
MDTRKRLFSLLLCFVLLIGFLPNAAAAAKLEAPKNLKLQGTVLSWGAVENADFYTITLYFKNYKYSIGNWQTDSTSINLYKYLKHGETYGATVFACSNSGYQVSNPAEIPLTTCSNNNIPIYRDVYVVNGTSSASTAYPGMSVRLEAKPAPDGMVFDRWELSGAYYNTTYSETDSVIYVQAICDHDIRARATYKYAQNVTSAFTVQPQGGSALVGESFEVSYAMNFTPKGTVKVQVEGNTPGSFSDLKQGTATGASIKEDGIATKTFRIMASDGTRNIYSDEFVVAWENGPRFTAQPQGGVVDWNENFVATYTLNFTPFNCRVERYRENFGWVDLSGATATSATIYSYDFNTTEKYRIKALIPGGGDVCSNEFTVTWSNAVSKFILHPTGGTVSVDEAFAFSFSINFTPTSNIAIQMYNAGFDDYVTIGYCSSMTDGTISGYANETTNKYRLEAYENGTPVYSNTFTVTWEDLSSITFADIDESSWQYPFAVYAVKNGLMAGKGTDGSGNIKFDPNSPITREEFVQVLYNAEGKPSVSIANPFPDVADGGWYKNAVLWAKQNDIASGKGNGNFGVGENISRQDLAMMLY